MLSRQPTSRRMSIRFIASLAALTAVMFASASAHAETGTLVRGGEHLQSELSMVSASDLDLTELDAAPALSAVDSLVDMAQGLSGPTGTMRWCGSLGEYTSWHNTGSWFDPLKQTLFVWKGGKDKLSPTDLTVKFTRSDRKVVTVPNSQKGVQTYSGPQVDLKNGWVGYFISKTWVLENAKLTWDDDWRWDVTGCLP